jgi:uncharacterized protein
MNALSFQPMDASGDRVSLFLRSVYGWMFIGLAVTALMAGVIASSTALVETVALNPVFLWVIVILELVLVLVLSSRIDQLQPATAGGLFILYSALTGITTSIAVAGALALYLDFINLFFSLLRLTGRRRDEWK